MSRTATRLLRLSPDRQAPARARAAIREVLRETRLTALLDDALLLTTELTTNAVVHAGTEIVLTVNADQSGIMVTVHDGRRRDLPELDSSVIGTTAVRGRGLMLVDRIADRWGTTHDPDGKHVWFELRPAAEHRAADPTLQSTPAATTATASRPRQARAGAPITGPAAASAGASIKPVPSSGIPGLGAEAEPSVAAGSVTPVTGAPARAATARTSARRTAARAASIETVPGGPDGAARAPRTREPEWAGGGGDPDSGDRRIRELIAENERLRHAELRRRAALTFMAEASELLAQSLDIELTIALVPRLVVPRLGEWCVVLRCAEPGAEPEVATATHSDEGALQSVLTALDTAPARSALRSAVHPGDRVVLGTADGLAVPLIARGHRLGVLAVGRPTGRRHDPDELALIADIARRAALAIDNAALHADRARLADTLQQALLPPVLPSADGLSFGAEYIPTIGAADVGGDFYDVLPLPAGRWLMVIGDVCGKGVAAAAVTGLVRDVMRILVREGRSIPEILDRVHETLSERGGGRFATLAAAEVTVGDGGGVEPSSSLRVRLHLAGHDRPILIGTDGQTQPVGAFGTALGLLDTVRTTGVDIVMAPGDTLVFFTDGVTERRRGEELFGLERTHAVLAPLAGHDPDIVAARLRAAAIGFSTEAPRDDIAILALRNDALRNDALRDRAGVLDGMADSAAGTPVAAPGG